MNIQGVIQTIVPPGGFVFPQVTTGGTVKITGFSFEQLIQAIIEFRRRHPDLCGGMEKAEMAVVAEDYRQYICRNFKQNCASATNSGPQVQVGGVSMSNYSSPIHRGGDWLAAIGNQRLEYVDAALAAQRAQICVQCPQNVRWQTPCQPCNENILVRTQNAKGSLATPYDRNLQVCRVYGHHNEVAVWLKDAHSRPDSQPPAHCWHVQGGQSGQ